MNEIQPAITYLGGEGEPLEILDRAHAPIYSEEQKSWARKYGMAFLVGGLGFSLLMSMFGGVSQVELE